MSALPSLFRWEQTMVRERGGVCAAADNEGRPTLWLIGGQLIFAVFSEADRPDMSHAGTRALVLEQARNVTGKPFLFARSYGVPKVYNLLDPLPHLAERIEWWVCDQSGVTYGRGPTEGDAVMDALRHAEARRG